MKNSRIIEEYLFQRKESIIQLDKSISNEKLYLYKKQFAPLFNALSDIKKHHKKVDKKICETIDILKEIENILEELKL